MPMSDSKKCHHKVSEFIKDLKEMNIHSIYDRFKVTYKKGVIQVFIQTSVREGETWGVHWVEGMVKLGKIRLNVYSFSVDGLLIDTGAPRLLNDFKPFFEKIDVDQVLLTHSHEDHVGGASYLQRKYHLPIYMNPIGIEANRWPADYPLYRKVFWGKRDAFQAAPLGEVMKGRHAIWDIIETPGHTKDHLSFLNRHTGQLFTGDLFVQPETKLILQGESIPTIIQSIKHVLTFDFEEIFCCHRGYVKNGRQMLQKN